MDNYKKFAISYLYHKATADMEKARMSFDLLLNKGVGIGDHSTGDFYNNLDEALDLLVDAQDRLEYLTSRFPQLRSHPPAPENPPF